MPRSLPYHHLAENQFICHIGPLFTTSFSVQFWSILCIMGINYIACFTLSSVSSGRRFQFISSTWQLAKFQFLFLPIITLLFVSELLIQNSNRSPFALSCCLFPNVHFLPHLYISLPVLLHTDILFRFSNLFSPSLLFPKIQSWVFSFISDALWTQYWKDWNK